MDSDTLAVNNETIHGYPMERLIREHSLFLYIITIGSLILGIPLALHILRHLRVASNARGRGVLRLLQREQQLNLILAVPAITGLLVIVIYPDVRMPWAPCLCLDVLVNLLALNRFMGCFTIVSGRLFYLFKEEMLGYVQEERFLHAISHFYTKKYQV